MGDICSKTEEGKEKLRPGMRICPFRLDESPTPVLSRAYLQVYRASEKCSRRLLRVFEERLSFCFGKSKNPQPKNLSVSQP